MSSIYSQKWVVLAVSKITEGIEHLCVALLIDGRESGFLRKPKRGHI